MAVNIHKIPPGSVVFEDVAKDVMRGRIKKTLKMNSVKKVNNDALIGRIVYETLNGWASIYGCELMDVSGDDDDDDDIGAICVSTKLMDFITIRVLAKIDMS